MSSPYDGQKLKSKCSNSGNADGRSTLSLFACSKSGTRVKCNLNLVILSWSVMRQWRRGSNGQLESYLESKGTLPTKSKLSASDFAKVKSREGSATLHHFRSQNENNNKKNKIQCFRRKNIGQT